MILHFASQLTKGDAPRGKEKHWLAKMTAMDAQAIIKKEHAGNNQETKMDGVYTRSKTRWVEEENLHRTSKV